MHPARPWGNGGFIFNTGGRGATAQVHAALVAQVVLPVPLDGSARDEFFAGGSCVSMHASEVAALPDIVVGFVDTSFVCGGAAAAYDGPSWCVSARRLAGELPGTEVSVRVLPQHYLRAGHDYGSDVHCYAWGIVPACIPSAGVTLGMAFLANVFATFDRRRGALAFAPSACPSNAGARQNTVAGPHPLPPAAQGAPAACAAAANTRCSAPRTVRVRPGSGCAVRALLMTR